MSIRNWLQCPSSITHGNIIKREIFAKKDPSDFSKEGAILDDAKGLALTQRGPRTRRSLPWPSSRRK